MTQTCALLICDQDKIPFDGEQVIYHAIDELPMHAIKVNDASALGTQLYVISRNDFEQSGDNAKRLLETIAFVPYRQIIAAISREQANQLSKGMQVLRWRDEHQFCSRCGSKTQVTTANEYAMNCPACGYHQYPRIQPCTINAIIRHIDNRPHLLLAHHQRARESGMYTLLAGFVEVGESLAIIALTETLQPGIVILASLLAVATGRFGNRLDTLLDLIDLPGLALLSRRDELIEQLRGLLELGVVEGRGRQRQQQKADGQALHDLMPVEVLLHIPVSQSIR